MTTIDENILFAPVHDLTRLIKKHKISPVELTEAYLARIEALSPKLHAFVTVTRELAMQQARQAEKEVMAGLLRGPLHGIPYGAKDLFAVKGYPTTWGARPYEHQRIDRDATVIQKLTDAGAILLGKCAMSELAGGPPAATATGPCRTPWDLTRWSGGSSSGSGSSVAAGLVAFALGTETWGSIMTPSSFCGVSGLRPTFGRVSRAGAMTLSWTMDKVGAIARSAMDCSAVLTVIAGKDRSDEMTISTPFHGSFVRVPQKIARMKVGFVKEDYEKYGEQDVARAFATALETFTSFGVKPEEVKLPDHPYETVAEIIIAAEEASAFEPLVHSGKVSEIIDPDRRGELLGAQMITAVDYLRCQRIRTLIARDFTELLARYDIILGSSTLQCAPPIDADMNTIFAGGNIIEAAENLLGLPAISIPCGFNSKNLPIGLKIIGRTLGESDVLAAAHLYQTVTDWHTKQPVL